MPKPIKLCTYIHIHNLEFLEAETTRRIGQITSRRGRNSCYSQIVREALELMAEYTAHSQFLKARVAQSKAAPTPKRMKPLHVREVLEELEEQRQAGTTPVMIAEIAAPRIDAKKDVIVGGLSPSHILGRVARRIEREETAARDQARKKAEKAEKAREAERVAGWEGWHPPVSTEGKGRK